MKLIEHLEEQIQNEIEHAKVTEQAFGEWQSNEVTKLFMAELKKLYLDQLIDQPVGDISSVYEAQIKRKSVCDILSQFLEWNPLKD